jgi:DNA-directed RNA polymerase
MKTHVVPIGAALVDIMLSCATLGHHANAVPAFEHKKHREGIKLVGYLELSRAAWQQIDLRNDDTMTFLAPKHQPMVVAPRPWRPSIDNPEGGYLLQTVPFIRTSNQKATHLKIYDTRRVSKVMNCLGNIRWRINDKILALMEEAWERDLKMAGIPAVEDPIVEEMPADDEELSEEEKRSQKLRRYNALRQRAELRSERPTFQLKLRVAKDFENAESLYFPHNIDFRGRAYPIPPHLNHIGDDVCRGLLMFAEAKPLGAEGFSWLKISLANLLGKDKLPLQDRIDFIDDNKDWIMKVADSPLDEANLHYWVDAPDGPWQALARIIEVADAWRSGNVEDFLSRQPVHMDGSCNGLQHYAALGRDEAGGQAVNLCPSDRPQDVYSIVLAIVKEKVQKDA